MAKKIFRLHDGGATNKTGWFTSSIITSDDLETIKTEGKNVATSIPTPFATIDLVKSAFKWVAEKEIKGNTAQHKLVSDALDVAQLFFTSQKFESKIRIVSWSPKDRLKELKEKGTKIHKKYAETLSLFWDQDSVEKEDINDKVIYNFEKVEKLYFILNKGTNSIIGGTSPATLFFASPDVRRATAEMDIIIGQDKLFDEEYASLPERDPSFIEYLYTLYKQKNFSRDFPEVYEYLEKVRLDCLGSKLKDKITALEADNIDNYGNCTVLENDNDICKILAIKLGVQRFDTESIVQKSDFLIKADYSSEKEVKPLVLPQYPFSKKWMYTTDGILWDEKSRIPLKNNKNAKESRLPIQNDPYYWLSIGNFLEEKIIELPYPIDDSKFETCGSKKHLLPLSKTFFKYFNIEKVSRLLKIEELSGYSVKVKLTIPVKRGEIVFEKMYSAADKNIVKARVHLAIFPFLKSKSFEITHSIGLLDDRLDKQDELTLSCLKEGRQQEITAPVMRNRGEGTELISKYYKVKNQPDVYGILLNSVNGFVVPKMKETGGSAKIDFAIDFGTTNTHIEYKYEGKPSVPFKNELNLSLIQSLLDNTENPDPIHSANEEVFAKEIFPLASETIFPLRTALVYNKDTDFRNEVEMIKHVNNYLLFDKKKLPNYLELNTQLKWNNYADDADERKVELYLEFLISIAFYKILQLGGNPARSNITWFYPVSMDEGELDTLSRLWNSVYKEVFKQDSTSNVKKIPESIAPYLYYKSKVEGLSLSVDIGGGSSDIAVFDEDNRNAKLIASFKFAGNTIFGDGYPSNEYKSDSDSNGFVTTFKKKIEDVLANSTEQKQILNDTILENKISTDFSNYLFALEKENKISFSYTRLLEKDKRLKLSILVFYGAIAYYSAKLLKKAGVDIPKYILLSGTASKTASIIDVSQNLTKLAGMFQYIFENVYGKNVDESLMIKLSDIPKELTCKGALKADISESIEDNPIKFWIGGTQDDSWGTILDKDKNIKNLPTYKELDDNRKEQIEDTIKEYYSILDEYMETINFESKYSIEQDAYLVFKKMRNRGIKDFITKGINAYHKKEDTKIEESLFFYPLVGMLNRLSYELAKNKVSNE